MKAIISEYMAHHGFYVSGNRVGVQMVDLATGKRRIAWSPLPRTYAEAKALLGE